MAKTLPDRAVLGILLGFVLLPRLSLVLWNPGHYDAGAIWAVLDEFIQKGIYVPSRHPGSPFAEFLYSGLRMLGEALGIVPHYLTNSAAIGFTTGALFYFYKILARWMKPIEAFFVALLFNFHPQMVIFGGATSDMPPLLFCLAYSFYCHLDGRLNRALIFAWLGCYCRIQGLALFVPLLWIWIRHQPRGQILRAFLSLGWIGLVFLPGFSYFGWTVFNPKFHGQMVTPHHKLGGFVYRTLNSIGPFGFLMVLVLLIKRFSTVRSNILKPLFLAPVFTVFVFFNAPWEAFYLLPMVAFAVAFWSYQVKTLKAATLWNAFFILNLLLPTFVQVRFKPWKAPFIEFYPGVLKAHFEQNLIVRGGG